MNSGKRGIPAAAAPRLLLLLPLLLLAGGAVLSRSGVFRAAPRTPLSSSAPLTGEPLQQARKSLEAENDAEAYRAAQDLVRARLLPPGITGDTAHFPSVKTGGKWSVITVTRQRPHRYRVQAVVEWRDPSGKEQRRSFETDLQHGPADDHWYLVDTEFLAK